MKQRLLGKATLLVLLVLALLTPLGGCFSYHSEKSERQEEHRDSDKHDADRGADRR
jgi:hypothetical protein